MSTLFMIGNGFDLNCGMKTRYKDVYDGYVKEESFTECLRKFKKTIASDIDNWGDFEMAMAEYAMNFKDEQEFLECTRDFVEYMEKYLAEESKKFKERLSNDQVLNSVIDEFRNSIASFHKDISHNVSRMMERRNASDVNNLNVVSFNYTEAFDCIGEWVIPDLSVVHIHGALGDAPVLGVDNVEQIYTKFELTNKGKRGFVKPIFNASYDVERVRRVIDLISRSNTICLYGLSMGESDLCWRNRLIEWLKSDERNHLFVYKYELAEARYGTVYERMDTEEDEKNKLFLNWGLDVDSRIFSQVHIPCGNNIFNIDEAIKRAKKQIHESKVKELEGKLQQGKKIVDNKLQEVAATIEV